MTWNKSSEAMPPERVAVLGFTVESGEYNVVAYRSDGVGWYDPNDSWIWETGEIDYWMPLPSSPIMVSPEEP